MSQKLVAFSDSVEKWNNFIINFRFIKGDIGGALSAPPLRVYSAKFNGGHVTNYNGQFTICDSANYLCDQ